MHTDLAGLLATYAKSDPKRAFGGLHALAGFDYQIRLYVAQLADSLARGGAELDKTGQVFLEALSDLAVTEGDGLVCIQAKRTLTRATLKKAAEEVIAVDRFLAQQAPGQHAQVCFSLVAAGGDSSLRWDDLPDTDRAALAPLQAAGRLLPPRVESDPDWRALVAVWDRLDDPFGFIRFALDTALGRGITADAQRVRSLICERYAQGRRAPSAPGRLLRPEDFDRSPDLSPRLDVGREVTLARVRDDQYMPRPGRRDALYALVEERWELARRDLRPAARVFWLSGRSGVGKSVLLMQLLERLVAEGRRVLWLGGRAEQLAPALRVLADQPEELRPEFVAIDDLYDRDARERLDLAGLGDFIDQAGPRSWPLILSCGPAEFADAFEQATRFRGFELYRETVHPVPQDESQRLAAWYRERRGREPASGSAFAQAGAGEGLFISLAVELEHGDLREFAGRFAERIQFNQLEPALRLPLALNRIYLRAPYDWLADDDRERLETFNQEGDLRLLDPGEPGRVIRLTHPHLADALYRALRQPGNRLAYAHDLARAFGRALDEGNLSLVSQLLGVLSAPRSGLAGERLADLDDERLADQCASAWQTAGLGPTLDTETAALIAAGWACWAVDQARIAAVLGSNLWAQAIAALNGAVKVWPYTWLQLWARRPGDPTLLDWAETHLSDDTRRRHPAWSFVWEQAQEAAPAQPVWRALGRSWLAVAAHRPDWHFVWKRLLPASPLHDWSDPLLRLGERRLDLGGDGPDWAYVLEDLLQRTPGLPEPAQGLIGRGWRWLPWREERAEWTHVWQALLAQTDQLPSEISVADLLLLGWGWLPGREERAEWAHVWQALLAQTDQLPSEISVADLLLLGWGWLPGREERAEWTYVWRALLEQADRLPSEISVADLLLLGWGWLPGREERAEWSYVWQALLEQADRLPPEISLSGLLALGWRWLPGREERAEWAHVWQALLAQTDQLPSEISLSGLLGLGWRWLPGREERAEWAPVWQALLAHGQALSAAQQRTLVDLGLGRLRCEKHFVARDSSRFVEGLLDLGCREPSLISLAARWLRGAMATKPWPIIAAKFIAAAPSDPAATELAEELTRRITAWPNGHNALRVAGLLEPLAQAGTALPVAVASLCTAFADQASAPAWARAESLRASGEPVQGTVVNIRPGFCAVELEIGLLARLQLQARTKLRMRETLTLSIIQVDPQRGRVDCERHGLPRPKSIDMTVGAAYDGIVSGVKDYGVFVRIGDQSGLIHDSKLRDPEAFRGRYQQGYSIRVKVAARNAKGWVLEPVEDSERVATLSSLSDPTIEVGSEFEARTEEIQQRRLLVRHNDRLLSVVAPKLLSTAGLLRLYPTGSLVRVRVCSIGDQGPRLEAVLPADQASVVTVGAEAEGGVASVAEFGLFLDLGDYQGLLHRSKFPPDLDFAAVYPVGSRLRVRIDEIRDSGISLVLADLSS